MILEEAVVLHGRVNLTEANDWYDWPINPSYLPVGVALPEGSYYAQNIALKMQLSALYSSSNNKEKQEIIRYYIVIWGGIRKNKDETIWGYAFNSPASLIAKGTQGIASWSKALSIRYPNDYAIYDARVAVSLNCLQIAMAVNRPISFPLLTTQNKLIKEGNKKLRQYAITHGWSDVHAGIFYQKYNNILSSAAKLLEVNPHTMEMLLFAKAPELLQTTFPEEKFYRDRDAQR